MTHPTPFTRATIIDGMAHALPHSDDTDTPCGISLGGDAPLVWARDWDGDICPDCWADQKEVTE